MVPIRGGVGFSRFILYRILASASAAWQVGHARSVFLIILRITTSIVILLILRIVIIDIVIIDIVVIDAVVIDIVLNTVTLTLLLLMFL